VWVDLLEALGVLVLEADQIVLQTSRKLQLIGIRSLRVLSGCVLLEEVCLLLAAHDEVGDVL
jgi:hypothetical protein